MNSHLTDDQLLDRLYGISSGEGAHLENCPDCQSRWSLLQQRRDMLANLAPPSSGDLHRQRLRIQQRLDRSPAAWKRVWAPAAVAIVLLTGLWVTRPRQVDSPPAALEEATQMIEVGWFEDTYSATRIMEPRAASPIRELFMEGPVLE